MKHDQTPGSQNCKLGQVEYPRWTLLLKIAKITKSTSSSEPLDILGMEYQRNIGIQNCENEKKSVVQFCHSDLLSVN